MNKASLQKCLVALLFSAAMGAHAQSIPVTEGNENAVDCYGNATTIATVNTAKVTIEMIDACNRALNATIMNIQDRAATFVNRGILLARKGELAKALADYDEALSLIPQAGEIYLNRGFIYYFEGQSRLAISDFDQAIELDPERRHLAYLGRGLVHEVLGMLDLAEEDYRKALEHRPEWNRAEELLNDLLAGRQAVGR